MKKLVPDLGPLGLADEEYDEDVTERAMREHEVIEDLRSEIEDTDEG